MFDEDEDTDDFFEEDEYRISDTLTLTSHLLGLEPYILIKLVDDRTSPEQDEIGLDLTAGGGIDGKQDILDVLEAAIETVRTEL